MSGRPNVPSILAALAAGVLGTAGWLAWRHHAAAVDDEVQALPTASGAMHAAGARPFATRGEIAADRQRREGAARQRMLARAIVNQSMGQDAGVPDFNKLSVAELQDLLEALAPVLSGAPAARQVFCYQTVLSALQYKDSEAGLESLERLNQSLPKDDIPAVWVQVAGIFFSSIKPADLGTSVAWLKDHEAMFTAATAGLSVEPAYQEIGQALATSVARQDLSAGFRTMEELGLPREMILPALARQMDSPEDWARLLPELHAGTNLIPGGTRGTDSQGLSSGLDREVYAAANSKIGQMSAEEGMAWLAAVPFSTQDLESVLTNIEAGPIQDPWPWIDWMESRLTPEQAARVRTEWSKRMPSISGEAGE